MTSFSGTVPPELPKEEQEQEEKLKSKLEPVPEQQPERLEGGEEEVDENEDVDDENDLLIKRPLFASPPPKPELLQHCSSYSSLNTVNTDNTLVPSSPTSNPPQAPAAPTSKIVPAVSAAPSSVSSLSPPHRFTKVRFFTQIPSLDEKGDLDEPDRHASPSSSSSPQQTALPGSLPPEQARAAAWSWPSRRRRIQTHSTSVVAPSSHALAESQPPERQRPSPVPPPPPPRQFPPPPYRRNQHPNHRHYQYYGPYSHHHHHHRNRHHHYSPHRYTNPPYKTYNLSKKNILNRRRKTVKSARKGPLWWGNLCSCFVWSPVHWEIDNYHHSTHKNKAFQRSWNEGSFTSTPTTRRLDKPISSYYYYHTRHDNICWGFSLNHYVLEYMHWSFRSSFAAVLVTGVLGFFTWTMLFATILFFLGRYDPDCLGGIPHPGQEGGANDANDVPSDLLGLETITATDYFTDAYVLSWTSFSTVGYGLVYSATSADEAKIRRCAAVTFVVSLESFLGVLYGALCGAIMFAKVMRTQSIAQVLFSTPLVIRYGTGVSMEQQQQQTQQQGSSQPEEEENLPQQDQEEQFDPESGCPSTDQSTTLTTTINNNNNNNAMDDVSQHHCPCPILEFRIANRWCHVDGGELLNATVKVVASIPESQAGSAAPTSKKRGSHRKKLRSRSSTTTTKQDHHPSAVATFATITHDTTSHTSHGEEKNEREGDPAGDHTEIILPKSFKQYHPQTKIKEPKLEHSNNNQKSSLKNHSARASAELGAQNYNNHHLATIIPTNSKLDVSRRIFSWKDSSFLSFASETEETESDDVPLNTALNSELLHHFAVDDDYDCEDDAYNNDLEEDGLTVRGGRKPQSSQRYRKIFAKVPVEMEEHPFFQRTWMLRHSLNEQSPLLTPEARAQAAQDGPSSWATTAEGIRQAVQFDQILVSLSGTSNAHANTVYAQHVYDYDDLIIGYRFSSMLYRTNPPSTSTTTLDHKKKKKKKKKKTATSQSFDSEWKEYEECDEGEEEEEEDDENSGDKEEAVQQQDKDSPDWRLGIDLRLISKVTEQTGGGGELLHHRSHRY